MDYKFLGYKKDETKYFRDGYFTKGKIYTRQTPIDSGVLCGDNARFIDDNGQKFWEEMKYFQPTLWTCIKAFFTGQEVMKAQDNT